MWGEKEGRGEGFEAPQSQVGEGRVYCGGELTGRKKKPIEGVGHLW